MEPPAAPSCPGKERGRRPSRCRRRKAGMSSRCGGSHRVAYIGHSEHRTDTDVEHPRVRKGPHETNGCLFDRFVSLTDAEGCGAGIGRMLTPLLAGEANPTLPVLVKITIEHPNRIVTTWN